MNAGKSEEGLVDTGSGLFEWVMCPLVSAGNPSIENQARELSGRLPYTEFTLCRAARER